jgi:hypothetical protein
MAMNNLLHVLTIAISEIESAFNFDYNRGLQICSQEPPPEENRSSPELFAAFSNPRLRRAQPCALTH